MSKPKNPEPPSPTTAATDRAQRRQALSGDIAGLVLQHGLGALALRGLAEQLDTSGRMLLYYFGTKENLVIEAMDQIALRLAALLARYGGGPLVPPGQFLANVLDLAGDPAVAPFMRVFTELVARGARGEPPYDIIAKKLVDSWIAWIESRLAPPVLPGSAEALLGIVEGLTLLDMAAPGSAAQAKPYLVGKLGTDAPR
jgi:AcrR family transcriptional regulator